MVPMLHLQHRSYGGNPHRNSRDWPESTAVCIIVTRKDDAGQAVLKFTRDTPGAIMIRSVSAEQIRIGDKTYREPIVLTTETVLDAWRGGAVADLSDVDFEFLFEKKPELVILGTGASNEFPPRELVFAFARRGIGLEVMDTQAAARTFNVLASEGRRLAAVLYL